VSHEGIRTLVLQEFRLSAVDTEGVAARIVEEMPCGLDPGVPLLTSIDDRHDVATIRAVGDAGAVGADAVQRAALNSLVSTWQPERRYVPRIAERSQSPPTHYRLAVTESGINAEETGSSAAERQRVVRGERPAPIDLLWIGVPRGTHAGLLILLGDHDVVGARSSDPPEWPLPMSRSLGVRIYDSQA
jgi:hypothetical protein